jgi:hypothetical protein
MSVSAIRRRRVACGIVLLAVLASAGGLHHHEDLAGAFQPGAPGAATDRYVSNHSPLEKAAHWHTGVHVKEDPCLACHGQRMAGLPADPCVDTPLALVRLAFAAPSCAAFSVATASNGSRAPPALL